MPKIKPLADRWPGREENDRVQTTVRIPQALLEDLRDEAGKIGVSLNSYILILIDRAHQDQPG